MKWFLRRVFPFFLFLLFLSVSLNAQAANLVFTGRALGVSDGDTLSVMREGRAVKVCLHGIDCPGKGQAFGAAGKTFTSDLAFGKEVTVHVKDMDRYGRTVAEITLPDGTSLNQQLVGNGLAWWYRKYAPNDQVLQSLEAEARAEPRGLWSQDPVPPWEWRKEKAGPK